MHTPGPWYVKPVHGEANNSAIVLNDGKGGWVFVVKHNGEAVEERQQADARLIAAAPALLAALRDCLVALEDDRMAVCVTAITRNARAAIAKAEGR